MVLKRLVLENYCQHEHRELTIEGNLIAVVGHNGVGKSNFLGAIQFVLTGEQGGKNKADLLHWGAKSGYVLLEFEHEGRPGTLRRSCSDNKVTLEYDGITTSGITNVAKEMAERLKFDKDLGKQAVFVRQTEVDTIISAKTDKRDRELAFQRLLGIDAAKIHKTLTDWLYAKGKPENYDIQIAENVKRLEDLETRLADTEAAVKAAEADRVGASESNEAEIAEVSGKIRLHDDLSAAEAELAGAERELAVAISDKAVVEVRMSMAANPGVSLTDSRAALGRLSDERAAVTAYEFAKAEHDRAVLSVQACNVMPHSDRDTVSQMAEAVQEARDELASVRGNIKLLTETLQLMDHANAGGNCTCPVCKGRLDPSAGDSMRAELATARDRETALTSAVRAASTHLDGETRKLRDWEVASLTAAGAEEASRRRLESAPAPARSLADVESEMTALKSGIAAQEQYESSIASALKEHAAAEARITVLGQRVSALKEKVAAAQARLGADDSRDALALRLAELDRQAEQVKAMDIAIARAKASRDEVSLTIRRLRDTVAELRTAQERQDRLTEAIETLTRTKDWFHYQNGPRQLTNQVLLALTDDVNKFLGNFTAPFVVIPDTEQLGFRVEFTDGRTMPEEPPTTEVLSGGERVQLAVAFRLAIYCMFAGKLGLLSLDEPTAYLDDSNVDRFGLLLQKVKSIAANMNTQVFMATHERSVIPHMDSVIDLND